MSFFTALIYDRLMSGIEESCLSRWRTELLSQLSGDILELGAGTGVNLELYPNSVTRLVLSEPDGDMRKKIQDKMMPDSSTQIEITSDKAEAIGADDESFDFVVMTLVGCSVTDPVLAFNEIKRVLRKGGSLVFMEHIGAHEGSRQRLWQNRITPFWRRVAGNCHLNRDTEQSIIAAGFTIQHIQREDMPAPSFVRPTIRGLATKITS